MIKSIHLKNFGKHKELKLVRISYELQNKIPEILNKILIEKKFRDYSLGKYEQVLGKSVIFSDNIYYIGGL